MNASTPLIAFAWAEDLRAAGIEDWLARRPRPKAAPRTVFDAFVAARGPAQVASAPRATRR